jgi:hypothetical protein
VLTIYRSETRVMKRWHRNKMSPRSCYMCNKKNTGIWQNLDTMHAPKHNTHSFPTKKLPTHSLYNYWNEFTFFYVTTTVKNTIQSWLKV